MNDQLDEVANCCNVSGLQDTITNMDELSAQGFSTISAMVSLLMGRIDSGNIGGGDIEEIYQVLSVIRDKSRDIGNEINSEAESVGLNHVSDRVVRRIASA